MFCPSSAVGCRGDLFVSCGGGLCNETAIIRTDPDSGSRGGGRRRGGYVPSPPLMSCDCLRALRDFRLSDLLYFLLKYVNFFEPPIFQLFVLCSRHFTRKSSVKKGSSLCHID